MCFVWIADLQQASCQPGTPTTPWDFIPSLGIGFLCGYLDTDQNLAQLQPSQEQPHKFSHQGKLSSLRDVPWPRCYLDIFIYITVAHGGWAETKVPSHSAHTVTLLLPHRAAAHNSHFTPRWGDLSRAPQPAARPKICQQGSVLQALLPWSLQSRVSVSFFSQQVEVWSDVPPCATAHIKEAAQPGSSCPDFLCRAGLALLNLTTKSGKVINLFL